MPCMMRKIGCSHLRKGLQRYDIVNSALWEMKYERLRKAMPNFTSLAFVQVYEISSFTQLKLVVRYAYLSPFSLRKEVKIRTQGGVDFSIFGIVTPFSVQNLALRSCHES